MYLRHVIASARDSASGNRFAQGLHDGGILSDKQKRLAVGVQFIDIDWEQNHAICLSISSLRDASAGPTADLLRKMALERMRVSFDEAVASLKQDLAAAAVAKAMEYEVDHCHMHQTSNNSQSAVGMLWRKKNFKAVNPFPEGVYVTKTAHDMGKYFSYSTRNDDLAECCKSVEAATLKIKLDINGTRVTAQHGLLYSILRLNKALMLFQMKYAVDWSLKPTDWENIKNIDAVLAIADKAIKLAQHEKLFMGALSSLVKMDMLKLLRSVSISVVDLEAVTASPRMPKVEMGVEDLSPVISECLRRACLEAERRYCGNKTEELTWSDYCPSKRELGATLLDLRTVNANQCRLRKEKLPFLC